MALEHNPPRCLMTPAARCWRCWRCAPHAGPEHCRCACPGQARRQPPPPPLRACWSSGHTRPSQPPWMAAACPACARAAARTAAFPPLAAPPRPCPCGSPATPLEYDQRPGTLLVMRGRVPGLHREQRSAAGLVVYTPQPPVCSTDRASLNVSPWTDYLTGATSCWPMNRSRADAHKQMVCSQPRTKPCSPTRRFKARCLGTVSA